VHKLITAALLLVLIDAYAEIVSVEDPYIWLEDVQGAQALAWVEEQNKKSIAYLERLPAYELLRARNLAIYDSEERILTPALRGDFVYNFWTDAMNRRGLWRRAARADYVTGEPDWEVVLDLDALAKEEGEDWVWKGATCLRPDYRLCLL
jgi:prolyl oligopeptidase